MEGKSEKPAKSGEPTKSTRQRAWQDLKRVIRVLSVAAAVVAGVVLVLQGVIATRPRLTITCVPGVPYEELVGTDGGVPTTRYHVRDQIIVSGPSSDVRKVVEEVGADGVELMLVRSCQISYRPANSKAVEDAPFPRTALRDLTTDLYLVAGGSSTEQALEDINEEGRDSHVFADPNYLTGLLGQSACGNPYALGASPYALGASPYALGASPYALGASTAGGAGLLPQDAFWSQWALGHTGLDASELGWNRTLSSGTSGDPVRVAVFDTSPFTRSVVGGQSTTEVINWVTPALRLGVSQPELLPLVPADLQVAGDLSDHGLFVAGLVHAVAPESEICLIRVLNDYGCGDLYTLSEAILTFSEQVEADHRRLDGAVINLSMGVLKPAEEDVDNDPIEMLQVAIDFANERGVVVVAAAGNDSYLESAPLPPQIPAAYPGVVGVAASNAQRRRSCFSNWGDVAAPGGDGGRREDSDLMCAPVADLCEGPCREAVTSLALSSPNGYAYWSGSSFSTPLVSGLAALIMQEGAGWCRWADPDEVFNAIRCGAPTPDGVINIPATLTRCMP